MGFEFVDTCFRIYSVLLQTEEDYVCFVCEAPGLRLLTEALLASFEAPHHVPIFHSSPTAANNAAMSAAAAAAIGGINARADLINLLTKVIRNYRQHLDSPATATTSTGVGSVASSSTATSSSHTSESKFFLFPYHLHSSLVGAYAVAFFKEARSDRFN